MGVLFLIILSVILSSNTLGAQSSQYLSQFPTPQQLSEFLKGRDEMETAYKQAGAASQLSFLMSVLSSSAGRDQEQHANELRMAYGTLEFNANQVIRAKTGGPGGEAWAHLTSCFAGDKYLLDDVLQHFLTPQARSWVYAASKWPMPSGERPNCPSELPAGTVLPSQRAAAIPPSVLGEFPSIEQVANFVRGETPLDTKLKLAAGLQQLSALIYHLNNSRDEQIAKFVGAELQSQYSEKGMQLSRDPALLSTADPFQMTNRVLELYQKDKWFRDELMRKFFKPQTVEWMYTTLKERPPTAERLVWATTGPQPGPPDPAMRRAKAAKLNALFKGAIQMDEPLDIPFCERVAENATENCVVFEGSVLLPRLPVFRNVYSKAFYLERLMPKGPGSPRLPDFTSLTVLLIDNYRPSWMRLGPITVRLNNGRVVAVSIPTFGLSVQDDVRENLITKFGKPTLTRTGSLVQSNDKTGEQSSHPYADLEWLDVSGLHVEYKAVSTKTGRGEIGQAAGEVLIETHGEYERRMGLEKAKNFGQPDELTHLRRKLFAASKWPMPSGERPNCPSELPAGTVLPSQRAAAIPPSVLGEFPSIEQVANFVRGETPLDTKLKLAAGLQQLSALIYHLNNSRDEQIAKFVGAELQSQYSEKGMQLSRDPALLSTADPFQMTNRVLELYQKDKWFRDELMRNDPPRDSHLHKLFWSPDHRLGQVCPYPRPLSAAAHSKRNIQLKPSALPVNHRSP